MFRFFFALLALTLLASSSEARPVAFRGGHVNRGAAFRGHANLAARVLFPGAAIRQAFRGDFRHAFRGHAAFRHASFVQPFYGSQAFYGASFVQPYVAPFVQPFVAPAYTQGFAAETGCGGAAYVQPFAAYSAFGVSPFFQRYSFGYGHGHGGHGSPFRFR